MTEQKNNLQFIISLTDRISKPVRAIEGRVVALSNQINNSTNRMRAGFALGTGAVLGLAGALAPVLLFERAMGQVAVTGENAGVVLDQMRVSAFRLNAEFGAGLSGSVAALNEGRRVTGLTGNALELAARYALQLNQQYADLDRRQIFAVQAALIRDFNLNVSEASDNIGYLVQRGGDLRGELLDSLLEYGVQFRELGFDIRGTVAATQTALDRGWSVDKMLDAVKEGGIKLRELGSDQVSSLATLGLSDLVPKIRAGEIEIAEVMARIGERVKTLDNDTERFNVIKKIFGAPAEDVGVDAMIAMLGALGDNPKVKGAMDKLTALWQQTPIALILKLKGQTENLAAAFGSLLLPVLLPVIQSMIEGVAVMRDWAKRFPHLAQLIGRFVLAIFGLALGMAALKFAFGGISLLLVPFRAAWMLITAAVWAFNAALSANLVAWIVVGIVVGIIALIAAIALAVIYWDEIKAAGVLAWNWIADAWGSGVDWLISKWESVKSWFAGLWDWIVAGFVRLPALIAAGLQTLIGPDSLIGRLGAVIGLDFGTATLPAAPAVSRGGRANVIGGETRRAINNIANPQDNRRSVNINKLSIEQKERVGTDFLFRTLLAEGLG